MGDIPWEDIIKRCASAAITEFCQWAQVGIDVYISYRKLQAKLHSSPWFSAAFATVIAHGNPFFCLNQGNKSYASKVKFRQASNRCKRVLQATKLFYAKKPKENLALVTFGELFVVLSTKVNMLCIPSLCCLLDLIKQNCFLKTFLRTLVLMSQVSLYPHSFIETA